MKRKNFSLMELMVVLAIIGILLSFLFPTLKRARFQAKSASCVNNLKQAGAAIYLYAGDNENYLFTNNFINTLATKQVWMYSDDGDDTNDLFGEFHGGEAGYLEIYLGDDESAYNCPASTHASDDFGSTTDPWGPTTRQGVYTAFPAYGASRRKLTNNFSVHPFLDELADIDGYSRKPILFDPIIDKSPWLANAWVSWDTSTSKIHDMERNKIPVLMDDLSIARGDMTPWPENSLTPHDGSMYMFIKTLY